MNADELVIANAANPKQFLQHISFQHTWGELSDAMIYTSPQVARDLATKYSGVVVPLKAAASMKGRV